jgi:hypothetical protein
MRIDSGVTRSERTGVGTAVGPYRLLRLRSLEALWEQAPAWDKLWAQVTDSRLAPGPTWSRTGSSILRQRRQSRCW